MPPKPPPTSIGTTVTPPAGIWSISASVSRMPNAPWVQVQTVSRPSGPQSAVELWGSMYPWCAVEVSNSPSTMTSADSKPASTSPNRASTRRAILVGRPSTGSNSPSIVAALSLSSRIGADGDVASATLSTGGNSSYSTSIRSRASSATCGSLAQSAATGCPRCRTLSEAMTRSRCHLSGVGPRGVVTTASPGSGKSAPVITACTPSSASAFVGSMRLIRA